MILDAGEPIRGCCHRAESRGQDEVRGHLPARALSVLRVYGSPCFIDQRTSHTPNSATVRQIPDSVLDMLTVDNLPTSCDLTNEIMTCDPLDVRHILRVVDFEFVPFINHSCVKPDSLWHF